jgi:hypothetical protein
MKTGSALLVSLGVLALSVLAAARSEVPVVESKATPVVDVRAVGTLDRAIDALSVTSADARVVLRQTLGALPPSESAAARGVEAVLTRMPPPEAEFPCGASFLRNRARKELVRLREELLGNTPSPLEPEACYATPFAIDSTHLPAAIDIYGVDFDRVVPEMFLVSDAQFSDISAGLSKRSHYHLTFDPKHLTFDPKHLTFDPKSGGVQFSSGNQFLGLAWGHLIHYSIPIVHPKSALCRSRVEQVTPPDNVDIGLDARTGEGATTSRFRVRANMALEIMENGVNALVCATAQATSPDGVGYSGCANRFLFTIDPDRKIDGILENAEDRIAFVTSVNSKGVEHGSSRGPVRQWAIAPQGTDGTPPLLSITLQTLHVVSSENLGCVSPVAYAEAKRQHAIGPDTLRALDVQLARMPREVRALRPPYAPEPK